MIIVQQAQDLFELTACIEFDLGPDCLDSTSILKITGKISVVI